MSIQTYDLYDHQLEIIESNKPRLAMFGGVGCFKAGTKVLMYDGSSKNVEEIVLGDVLMGPDSTSRVVYELCRGVEDMFDIIPSSGQTITVNKSHILSLMDKNIRVDTISVKDYLLMPRAYKDNRFLYRIKSGTVSTVKFKIKPAGIGAYYGFRVDKDQLFLLDDFTVVHNSGKSYAMKLKFVLHLSKYPGARGVISRKVKEDIRRTIWTDFQDEFGDYILEQNKQELTIKMTNGSGIKFIHAYDDERGVKPLDGVKSCVFLLSQAEEIPLISYYKFQDRNRFGDWQGGKIKGPMIELIEGNPDGKGWVYNEFCVGAKVTEKTELVNGQIKKYKCYDKDNSLLVQVESGQYDFVADGYYERITKNHSDNYIKRYVIGSFDSYSGLIWDCFNEQRHIVKAWTIASKLPSPERFVRLMGLDHGFKNPTMVIWFVYDRKERIWLIYREYELSGVSTEVHADNLKRIMGQAEIDDTFGCIADTQIWQTDPIHPDKSVVKEYQASIKKSDGTALRFYKADKSVELGIERVWQLFNEDRIQIMDNCPILRRQIENYKRKDDVENKEPKENPKEQPLKKDDHGNDILRYVCFSDKIYNKAPDKGRFRSIVSD